MQLKRSLGRVARGLGGRWLPLKWGLLVAAAVLGLQALGAFARIEPLFTDLHFAARGTLPTSGQVVVVGVSPQCTQRLGQWPWPRARHAQLIRRLAEAGATVIAYDMYFATPSTDPQNDQEMADAARQAGNVVLAVYKRESLDLSLGRQGPLLRVDSRSIAQNIPALTAATAQGHINVRNDHDGVIRRVPAGLVSGEGTHYQLGLVAAALHLGVRPDAIRVERGGLRIGGRFVPVDPSGNLLINYYHMADQERPYTVSGVLEGEVPARAFRGKVVFIGQTDHGLQNADLVVTPEQARFGVFIQAAVADSILSGRVLRRAPPLVLALVVLALSIGCASRLFVRRVLGKVVWSLAFAAAAALLSHFVFERLHMLLDLTPCLAAVVVGNLYGALVFGILRADKQVERHELEMDTLIETGKLSAAGETVAVPERIASGVGRALGVEGCCLFLRNGDALELAASYGFAEGLPAADAARATLAANRWVAEQRKPFFADGSSEDKARVLADPRIRAALIVPLVCQDELYGTLGLYNKRPSDISPDREFTEHDFRLISLLTQQTALTLDRSHLAEHLQEALRSLEAAQQQLIEGERLSAVGKMANMIIHDIKNPMQGIRMFAEMAADANLTAADRREFSETMCHEIDRLVGMCQEILDFARGTTNLLKEDVPLDDFLRDMVAALGPELENGHIVLETRLGFGRPLRLDAGRMTRAVLNLCRNAIEAMAQQQGGTLRVATEADGGFARIEIADSGPGIPAAIVDKLFEPFVTHGKEHGTGLGLAIVKKVVEDHGGTVEFTTRAGQGTTFTLRLPMEAEGGLAPSPLWEKVPVPVLSPVRGQAPRRSTGSRRPERVEGRPRTSGEPVPKECQMPDATCQTGSAP